MSAQRFATWLRDQLDERGWSQQELADRSGISRTHITRVLTGDRQAGLEFYKSIAHAFRMPVPSVLAAAGEIPEADAGDPTFGGVIARLQQLPTAQQQQLLAVFHQLLDLAAPIVYPPSVIIGGQSSSSLQPDQIQNLDTLMIFAASLSSADRRRFRLMLDTTWGRDVDEPPSGASGAVGSAAA